MDGSTQINHANYNRILVILKVKHDPTNDEITHLLNTLES